MKIIFRLSIIVALLVTSFSVVFANDGNPEPAGSDFEYTNQLFLPVVVETQSKSGFALFDEPLFPEVSICEIQGDGQFSPYDGEVIQTTGVVTLFTANNANFWLQDTVCDDDPTTSDGIFVAGGGYPDEGPRHYIDIDNYPEFIQTGMNKDYLSATFEDLNGNEIVPMNIMRINFRMRVLLVVYTI